MYSKISRLRAVLAAHKNELMRRETSCGMYHDLRRMIRLREEIARVEARLARLNETEECNDTV